MENKLEIYELINQKIKEKGMSKREFANRVLALEPKLKNTGEIPTEKTIYAYLNGTANLKLELISFIAEALDVSEQEFFDDSQKARVKYLKHILKNPSKKEIELIKYQLGVNEIKIKNFIISDINSGNITINSDYINNDFKEAVELLQYASIPFLKNLIIKLKEFKNLSTSQF